MARFLAVVEGPHDASFLGVELRRLDFEKVEDPRAVDDYWWKLIPKVFPAGAKLEHVVRYPDIYRSADGADRTCAVIVAGGDSRLISELRATLESIDGAQIDAIGAILLKNSRLKWR